MPDDWSDDELAASVEEYRRMARLESLGERYSKKDIYRDLAKRFGRTDKAFEYRMQNISAVLAEMGEEWIPGLRPASNVGTNVKSRLQSLLRDPGRSKKRDEKAVASYRYKLPAMRNWLITIARNHALPGNPGKVTYGEIGQAFGLDRYTLRHALSRLGRQSQDRSEPIITALVVLQATGRCSDGLAREFGVRNDEVERKRLYDYWSKAEAPREPEIEDEGDDDLEQKAARFVSVEVRPSQAAFRRKVFLACKGCCVISGCDLTEVLDAAHRQGKSWRRGENRAKDGYLMRKDLHALYDRGLLTITPEGRVKLAPSVMQHYASFAGVKVRTPSVRQGSSEV